MHNLETGPEDIHAIQTALKTMVEVDQAMRQQCDQDPNAWDETIDHRNTMSLKQIVEEMGWPSISKVGTEASSHAWLLVQHADHDVEFQKHCLALMKAEAAGEVCKSNIAYLEDRIAISEGRPQIYGSQFHTNEVGQVVPLPIEDPEHVEERRQEMGLDPLVEHQQYMQERYGENG